MLFNKAEITKIYSNVHPDWNFVTLDIALNRVQGDRSVVNYNPVQNVKTFYWRKSQLSLTFDEDNFVQTEKPADDEGTAEDEEDDFYFYQTIPQEEIDRMNKEMLMLSEIANRDRFSQWDEDESLLEIALSYTNEEVDRILS